MNVCNQLRSRSKARDAKNTIEEEVNSPKTLSVPVIGNRQMEAR